MLPSPGGPGTRLRSERLTLPRPSRSLEVVQLLALSPCAHLWLSSSPRNSFSEGQKKKAGEGPLQGTRAEAEGHGHSSPRRLAVPLSWNPPRVQGRGPLAAQGPETGARRGRPGPAPCPCPASTAAPPDGTSLGVADASPARSSTRCPRPWPPARLFPTSASLSGALPPVNI